MNNVAQDFRFVMVGAWVAFFAIVAGISAGNVISDKIADHQRWREENKRGYIRCVDGHIEIGNIDFDSGGMTNAPLIPDLNVCKTKE